MGIPGEKRLPCIKLWKGREILAGQTYTESLGDNVRRE